MLLDHLLDACEKENMLLTNDELREHVDTFLFAVNIKDILKLYFECQAILIRNGTGQLELFINILQIVVDHRKYIQKSRRNNQVRTFFRVTIRRLLL